MDDWEVGADWISGRWWEYKGHLCPAPGVLSPLHSGLPAKPHVSSVKFPVLSSATVLL